MEAFGYDFAWVESPGALCRTSAKYFSTKEESDASFRRALVGMGYTPPKWWQYWRWGERCPSVAL
tara:strand:- start:186 stop:380 length:195 start_codon:yes stop_codon:yes gene_type:complete